MSSVLQPCTSFARTRLISSIYVYVPDQIGTLSQVGTKKSQKEAGPFKNFLSHVGTMFWFSKSLREGFHPRVGIGLGTFL